MTAKEQNTDWVLQALRQPEYRVSELYYFDQRDNEFFAFHKYDYELFDRVDDKLVLLEDQTSHYSGETLKVMTDRLNRIEVSDPGMIEVPRCGMKTPEMIREIMQEFLKEYGIDLDSATIWKPDFIVTI